jgi:hypothetical protein
MVELLGIGVSWGSWSDLAEDRGCKTVHSSRQCDSRSRCTQTLLTQDRLFDGISSSA